MTWQNEVYEIDEQNPVRCALCGETFPNGQRHFCSTYRVVYSGDTLPPPERIQHNGYWYRLEKGG